MKMKNTILTSRKIKDNVYYYTKHKYKDNTEYHNLLNKSEEYSIIREDEKEKLINKTKETIYEFETGLDIEYDIDTTYQEPGMYTKETLPENLQEKYGNKLEDKRLIVEQLLVGSGSNRITNITAYNIKDELNINCKINIPIIGSSDMKVYTIYVLIKEDIFKANNNKYKIRYIEE